MECMTAMNDLVFLKVVAYAAPNGKEVSNHAKFGAQKEFCHASSCSSSNPTWCCLQTCWQWFVKWCMWLNINDLATDCADLLIPKWISMVKQTWLILPVVICLSQRLSHACLSIRFKIETAHGSLKQL